MNTKIIFLDFDGVICTAKSYRIAKDKYGVTDTGFGPSLHLIDTELVGRVQEICNATGAKIVISSTWRGLHTSEEVEQFLRHHGLTAEIIGQTPYVHYGNNGSLYRGQEIQAWMRDHPEVKYTDTVALDDDYEAFMDTGQVEKRLVRTFWLDVEEDGEDVDAGIQPKHVKKAIEMLS